MKHFTLLRICLCIGLSFLMGWPVHAQDVIHKAPAPLYRVWVLINPDNRLIIRVFSFYKAY